MAEYTDEQLVGRVMFGISARKRSVASGMLMWEMVARAFFLGRASSEALCKRFGYDPDTGQEIKGGNNG